MNPILNLLKKQSPASQFHKFTSNASRENLQQMVSDLKAGKIDPKQTALGFLKNLNSQQKSALIQMLPQLKILGKTFGASDSSIKEFTDELQKQLK